jgi:hypothetical protein
MHISISRITSNREPDFIVIDIRDENYKIVTRVRLTLEDFARAISGVGQVDCQTY